MHNCLTAANHFVAPNNSNDQNNKNRFVGTVLVGNKRSQFPTISATNSGVKELQNNTTEEMGKMHADALHPQVEEVLLTNEEIQAKIKEVGRQLATDYKDKRPMIVCTLKGAVIFMSDLVRAIEPVPEGLELQFIRASSYGSGTSSTGKVALSTATFTDDEVVDRHVLLVEDIVDTGRTASSLIAKFQSLGAASCKIVTLLSKPSRREVEFEADYTLFVIPNSFVVGGGLDWGETLRSLPYIGVLKPELYESE